MYLLLTIVILEHTVQVSSVLTDAPFFYLSPYPRETLHVTGWYYPTFISYSCAHQITHIIYLTFHHKRIRQAVSLTANA